MSKKEKQKFKPIEIKPEEVEVLIIRLSSKDLLDSDYELLTLFVTNVVLLNDVLKAKNISIERFQKMIYGLKTEKRQNVLKKDKIQEEVVIKETEPEVGEKTPVEKKKGHGRNGWSAYESLEHVDVAHQELKSGTVCPECERGKLYNINSGKTIRLFAQPPIGGKVYLPERLRCNLCGEVFNAKLPKEAGNQKYSEEVGALVALLKYGYGFPFNRQEQIHRNFNIPLAASTLWEITERTVNPIYPVFLELVRLAAQGEVIHNDDTTVKILSHMKEKKEDDKRKGTFTTGIVSQVENRTIALYFSGENHAGENMLWLIEKREKNLAPPIQMCDGLSRNFPRGGGTIPVNCLSHGRRKFVEIYDLFKTQCRRVIEALGEVYRNDAISREMQMPPAQRLRFHQEKSKPVMDTLKTWMDKQIEEKLVEPNSVLGAAIRYMIKRWELITGFLYIENAPLDNNIAERALKRAILNRKNAYFYRTEFGAHIGDVFTSIIQTCNLAKVNAFEYLTVLQKNEAGVLNNPGSWLPWNYKENFVFKANA